MWWLIPLILLLFVVFLLFLKARLCIVYENEFSVKIKILVFNIPLFPKTPAKPNPRNFSVKKLKKKQDRLNKKALKKPKRQQASSPSQNESEKGSQTMQITEILEIVKIVLENVMSPLGKYLKVEIVKLFVRIGTADPAKTAVLYGVASQTVAYIIELLSNVTNVDVKKKNSVDVVPDFFNEKSDAKVNITLGLRVWHALVLAIKFFMGYINKKRQKRLKPVGKTYTEIM